MGAPWPGARAGSVRGPCGVPLPQPRRLDREVTAAWIRDDHQRVVHVASNESDWNLRARQPKPTRRWHRWGSRSPSPICFLSHSSARPQFDAPLILYLVALFSNSPQTQSTLLVVFCCFCGCSNRIVQVVHVKTWHARAHTHIHTDLALAYVAASRQPLTR